MLWPKKNSYKEFDNEKKFLRLENSPLTPSPHNFSNGPSPNSDEKPRSVHLPDLPVLVLGWESKGHIPLLAITV